MVVLEVSVGGFKAVAIEEVSSFCPFGIYFGESKISKTVIFYFGVPREAFMSWPERRSVCFGWRG